MYKDINIQGWMHLVELQFLYDQMLKLSPDSLVVEIGSWKGRSSHALASGILASGFSQKFYCIDTFAGAVTNEKQLERARTDNILGEFKKNLKGFDVNVVVGDSAKSSEQFADNTIDFIFLDANHDYEFVLADIIAWLPKLKAGAIICGHDYKEGYKGVKRAVDEIFKDVKTFPDSIWLTENKNEHGRGNGSVSSEVDINFLPEVSKYIDLQCNGDTSLYTGFPELKHIDGYLKDLHPKNVLDIGSGIGRASVYFFKKYEWADTKFNLLDGDSGDRQIYGVRSKEGEFYNSFNTSKIFCESNGLFDVKMWDASSDSWMHNLTNIDLAYSFLAIGFHWPLEFYLDNIYPILSPKALVIFGIRGTEKSRWIDKQVAKIDIGRYNILKFVHMPSVTRESVLVLGRK